jgi:hypothetical protein
MTNSIPISIPGPAQINVTLSSTGPRGPAGPAGGSVVSYPAGETLSTGRVVVITGGAAFYFQPSNPAHKGRAVGITTSSAGSIGATVTVQLSGVITDAAFPALTNVQYWVGANGVVQTSLPSSGNLQKAGIGVAATTLLIDFSTQATLL